jgi:hypothetical protein
MSKIAYLALRPESGLRSAVTGGRRTVERSPVRAVRFQCASDDAGTGSHAKPGPSHQSFRAAS